MVCEETLIFDNRRNNVLEDRGPDHGVRQVHSGIVENYANVQLYIFKTKGHRGCACINSARDLVRSCAVCAWGAKPHAVRSPFLPKDGVRQHQRP